MLKNKNIILGVTGSIAAYKAATLVNTLKAAGAKVDVIMTENATRFITPLTLQTLSGRTVYLEMFNTPEQEMELKHISLADRADVLVVAPATANVIGKVASGIADDLLTSTVMATKAPVLFAPAMNVHMWQNPVVRKNVGTLKKLGYHFAGPVKGRLACGYSGEGRLADIGEIVAQIRKLLKK